MTTLIDKLRAAETGSPELSFEVYKEFPHLAECKIKHGVITQSIIDFDPPLTESIDAALTLVPDTYRIQIYRGYDDSEVWEVNFLEGDAVVVSTEDHKSLPIAICMAVLGARK